MELKLNDFSNIKNAIKCIYQKIIDDEFGYLHLSNLIKPGSAEEYRNTLLDLLQGGILTLIPDDVFDSEVYVFKNHVEVRFYVNNVPSDIYGIFVIDNHTSQSSVYLYDIRIP